MISDFITSIVSAMLDICLLCCATTAFKFLISLSSNSLLALGSPTEAIVGVAGPDIGDACFTDERTTSSG
jgi:hypothetical protein